MKFNKIKLITALYLALGVSALGQNNVGTLVTDPIRPFSVNSVNPSAIANEIKGGPFTSSNLVGLSNIPAPRLEIGAIGYATNTGLYYRLTATNPATWSSIDGINITNLNASNITGSIPFLNISNALTNANVAFGTATFNNTVQGPIGTAANPAFRFGTNQSGIYYGAQFGFGTFVGLSIFGSNIARFQSNRVVFDQPIDFLSPTGIAALTTRTNLGIQDFVTNPVVPIVSGGTGATNAAETRTNLGLGATNSVFFDRLIAGATNQPENISGNIIAQNGNGEELHINSGGFTFYQGTNTGGYFGAEERSLGGGTWTWESPFTFSNQTNASITRTNLGLGWSGLTNTNAATFRSALEIGTTNTLTIAGIVSQNITVAAGGGITLQSTLTNAASFRTNIGLPWSGLTSTNAATFQAALFGANTNPVLVNTNGEVVSPTNFWQVAPIVTRFVESQPTANQTTNISAARNLHIHSLAISTVGVTNIIALPTNDVFNGDIALVVHEGPASSVTAVRQAGAATNLITLNKLDEAVEFVYYNNVWQFNHNQAFIEPIYFSGTNSTANAAASRTNLGLGVSQIVEFGELIIGGSLFAVDPVEASFAVPIVFSGTNSLVNASASRTNLGLPLAALTNTSNTTLQQAIFTTNAAPTNTANVNGVGFNTAVTWMSVSIVTNGVTNSYRIPLFQ